MFTISIPDAGKTMTQALSEYRRASGKDEVEILNAEGLNVSRETMRRMPKASATDIKAQLGTPKNPSQLAIRIAEKKLGPGRKKSDYIALASRIVTARLRSIAYIKAGQIPIIKAFGGSGRDPYAKGKAATSTGEKAKVFQPLRTATLTNKAVGAGKVGQAAQEAAIRFRAGRMAQSAFRRMESTARRFSGK